jgi:hypothetical protein
MGEMNSMCHRTRGVVAIILAVFFNFDSSFAGGRCGTALEELAYSRLDTRDRSLLIQKLLKTEDIFAQPEIYQLAATYEIEEQIKRWYYSGSESLIKEFKSNLNAMYLPILVDPGVACRIEDFIPFAKSFLAKNPDTSIFELRTAYSEDLNKRFENKNVFRGMILTDGEARLMIQKGIRAKSIKTNLALRDNFIHDLFDLKKVTGIYYGWTGEVGGHVAGDTKESVLISTTDFEPVARTVGYQNAGRLNDRGDRGITPTRSLYVFNMSIPEISIIRMTGPLKREYKYMFTIPSRNFKVRRDNPGLEGFVFSKISKEWITGWKRYRQAPDSYN